MFAPSWLRPAVLLSAALLPAILTGRCRAEAPAVVVQVSAGDNDRFCTPVSVNLPKSLLNASALNLVDIEANRDVPVQTVPGSPPRIVWLVRDLAAQQTRRYRLTAAAREPATDRIAQCDDDGGHLTLRVGQRPVLTYNYALQPAPNGIDPVYAKSGYIHPMHTPAGRLVTDDFAPDHAHQHGIFFAWVNSTFEGRSVDFWNQAQKLGTVEHLKIVEQVSGPVFAQFTVRLRHSDLNGPDGPKPVLEELWTVRAYNTTDCFLVDLQSKQRCVADEPLVVNKYHYGGMGLRAARQWYRQPGNGFLTSGGKTREDGNHTRARWVITHGKSDGEPAVVAVLGHPDNFRAPQHVRLHPEKPYFCFAPMVIGAFELAPGKPYLSRYRYATWDGEPDAGRADRLWQDYAEPPAIHVSD